MFIPLLNRLLTSANDMYLISALLSIVYVSSHGHMHKSHLSPLVQLISSSDFFGHQGTVGFLF
jgi:hypothetical protein